MAKITPVTPETFAAWKDQKRREREAELGRNRRTAEETYRRTGGGISGRDLFEVDKSIFADDAEAVEQYEFEEVVKLFLSAYLLSLNASTPPIMIRYLTLKLTRISLMKIWMLPSLACQLMMVVRVLAPLLPHRLAHAPLWSLSTLLRCVYECILLLS